MIIINIIKYLVGLLLWLILYASFGFLLIPWFGELTGLFLFAAIAIFFSFFGERWLRGVVFESKRPFLGHSFYESSELAGLYVLGEFGENISIVSGQDENSLFSEHERVSLDEMRRFYLKKSELVLLTMNVCFLCLPYYLIILIPFIGEKILTRIYLFLLAPLVLFLKRPTGSETETNLFKITEELNIQSDFSSIISKVVILKEAHGKTAATFLMSPLSLSLLLSRFSNGE